MIKKKSMNEGVFSIIVPAHKLFKRVDGKYEVEACIDSIIDQDYKKYEVILCINGPDRAKIRKVISEGYGNTKVGIDYLTVITTEEANAAIARNAGADIAVGEFYSFLSSDCVLKPGALSIWKEAFDANPKAAIIYSDIHYMEAGEFKGQVGRVPDYDPYVHESQNMIDGAMPVRAKYNQAWYPEVKALQDWAWSLHVLHGKDLEAVKIQDTCYMSEMPKEGGLSDHFSKNWIPLNKQIKKLHNIPIRKVCVTSIGAPYHGIKTAKLLDADFLSMPSWHPHDYEAVYLLGYYCTSFQGQQAHNSVFANMKPYSLRILHWIGSDIMSMWGMPYEANRNTVETLNEFVDIQLAEYEQTAAELREMRIKTDVLPLPLDVDNYPIYKTKPKNFTVAVYFPGNADLHYAKYNLDIMIDLAKAMPDINFIFFGNKEGYPADLLPKNAKGFGWVDIKKVAEKSNAILRLTIHDGLPMAPVEFLMMGRDALTSVKLEGAYHIGEGRINDVNKSARKDQIIDQIRQIQKKPLTFKARKDYIEYWRKTLDYKEVKKKFYALLKKRKREVKKALVLEAKKLESKLRAKDKKDVKGGKK